ncbi:hypothetical protein NDU88_007573 [Pleurodeles waltl]|uniref:Uncharacterized protein n=1 Tax=Pleurodeles waltl TaxID=8319 RepID=A0AAV7PPD6_PLEWA|nr:hypothetical protein NDU88_007573 [Pleurodeles waltl]
MKHAPVFIRRSSHLACGFARSNAPPLFTAKGPGCKIHTCDGPDWADPHTASACSAAFPRDPGELSPSSNHGLQGPSRRELGGLKDLPAFPTGWAIGSGKEKRSTADEKKEEDVEDRKRPGVPSGSSDCAEPTAPSADCRLKEYRKKPAVPSRDEEDRLRGVRREDPPRFRRSVAGTGAWGFPEQG